MDKKKKEEDNEVSIKKLESEFHSFQLEWKKFLTNEFHHLVVNVDTLVKQNDGIQQNVSKMSQDIQTVQNCIKAIDEGIVTLIKREH